MGLPNLKKPCLSYCCAFHNQPKMFKTKKSITQTIFIFLIIQQWQNITQPKNRSTTIEVVAWLHNDGKIFTLSVCTKITQVHKCLCLSFKNEMMMFLRFNITNTISIFQTPKNPRCAKPSFFLSSTSKHAYI